MDADSKETGEKLESNDDHEAITEQSEGATAVIPPVAIPSQSK